MTITQKIKQKGLELGYTHVGITTADDFLEYETELLSRPDYEIWTQQDRSKYPGRSNLRHACRPRGFYPQGKSIICATFGYSQYDYPEELLPYVARAYLCRGYTPQPSSAAGIKAVEFKRFIRSLDIDIYGGKGELPDRMACARAGIITYGKNNFAYTKEDGSFNILYTFLVDRELVPDEPSIRCDCPAGCSLCIQSCPTQAIPAAGKLHPQKCMMNNNQLPIGKLPKERWASLGTHIHGCDICQVACPRNQAVLKKATRKDPLLEELKGEFDLEKILDLDDEYYEQVVEPIMYNYIRDRNIFRRNAAIALGNLGDKTHLPALHRALNAECNEVREAAQWAIEQLT